MLEGICQTSTHPNFNLHVAPNRLMVAGLYVCVHIHIHKYMYPERYVCTRRISICVVGFFPWLGL